MTEQDYKHYLINDCYKYIMELTTNGVVITDAIKFVQTNKEKLTLSKKEEVNGEDSKEPDYDENKDELEEEQEEETGELGEEKDYKSSLLSLLMGLSSYLFVFIAGRSFGGKWTDSLKVTYLTVRNSHYLVSDLVCMKTGVR